MVRVLAVVAGAVLVVAAWWQVFAASADLTEVSVDRGGVPVTLLLPPAEEPVPGVVVAHGFAGSGQLMRSFGLALADAGYAVALVDLSGHGANRRPLGDDRDDDRLVADVTSALAALRERPEVDDRLALLGHSMGAGVVLRTGIEAPDDIRALVAVSPTDAAVTSRVPPDLLLVAGEREPRFVANAEELLERAGGVRGAPGDGDARALEVIPGVEHVCILFSPTSHRVAVAWLDAALEHESTRSPAVAVIGWWIAHLVGVLLIWRALASAVLPQPTSVRVGQARVGQARVSPARALIGLIGGGLVAVGALAGLVAALPVAGLGGLLVAPLLAAWFAVAGAAWLLAGARPPALTTSDLPVAALLLVVLVAAFGLLAQHVWLPWFPIAPRAVRAPVLALLILPWTVAWAATLDGRRGPAGFAWWAAVSAGALLGVGIAALVVPALGFVMLLLPLLPALLGLAQVVSAPAGRPWAAAIATAAFLGWTLAVLFPLA